MSQSGKGSGFAGGTLGSAEDDGSAVVELEDACVDSGSGGIFALQLRDVERASCF